MTKRRHIPFIDLYSGATEQIADGVCSEIRKMVAGSQFILGERVSEFEKAFAKLAGCRFAIGVNSGLDSLVLALRALKIGAGDEVITVPNSFVASAAAISLAGAKPVFVDVAEDYNLDPSRLDRAITHKTRAIMPVHLTGNPCRIDEILEIARPRGILVIEDAAQAVGATYRGRPVGSWGDIGCFSLHPLKNLHVWGDGGVITVNQESLQENLLRQRNHGLVSRDESEFYSYNSRLDNIQAIVGLAYIRTLAETNSKRRSHARIYREQLSGISPKLKLPPPEAAETFAVYHVFQIWTEDRNALARYLAEKGIETKIHYPIPIHLQKASAALGYRRGDFPVAERLAEGILSLPVRENLSSEDLHYICETVRKFYSETF